MKNKLIQEMYTYHVKEMMFAGTCKKSLIKILVCIALTISGILLVIIPHLLRDKSVHLRAKYPTDLKYILFWNQPKKHHRGRFSINKPPEFAYGQSAFIAQNCSHINCFITYDKSVLAHDEDYDAIVFDIDSIKKLDIDRFNLTRAPEQLYIFRSRESPEKHSMCNHEFDHFFNLTWTYKLNSDVPQPFFNIYFTRNKTIVGPRKGMVWIDKMKRNDDSTTATIKNKSKAVAWIVNKCKLKTKHQDFIEELRNELKGYNHTIELYGSCGNHKCSSISKCNKMIENNYYFQLVLEEYLAEDYVTENIVNAVSLLTIPIVIGAGDYKNFLPPGSYINAQAFDLKKLGALIDYLIKNPEMYEYFFDWKNHYYYKESPRSQVCALCEKLNKINRTRTYKHFRYWWDPDYKDICQRMRLYKMFNNDEK